MVDGEGVMDIFNRVADVKGCKVAPLPYSLYF